MRARTFRPSRRRSSDGLSLIEVLVGIAIGLIGIVAIFQAVAVFNQHTQSTSSGGDAQVAGTLALFNIERDLKQAGHGFGKAGTPVMGCLVAVTDSGPPMPSALQLRTAPGRNHRRRVGHSGPDQRGLWRLVLLCGREHRDVFDGNHQDAQAPGGLKLGDLAVVAVNPGASAATASCQLIEITDDLNPDGVSIAHTDVPYTNYYHGASSPQVTPRFNNPASAPLGTTGTMYNLGPQPVLNTGRFREIAS